MKRVLKFLFVCVSILVTTSITPINALESTLDYVDFNLSDVLDDGEEIYYFDDEKTDYLKITIEKYIPSSFQNARYVTGQTEWSSTIPSGEYTFNVEKSNGLNSAGFKADVTIGDTATIDAIYSPHITYTLFSVSDINKEIVRASATSSRNAIAEMTWICSGGSVEGTTAVSFSGYINIELRKICDYRISWKI